MTSEEAADRVLGIAMSLGYSVAGLTPMTSGYCHHVFEVACTDGPPVVVRLGTPATARALRGGIAWNRRLEAAGVPVPTLLHSRADSDYPWMVLERLAGRDLLHEIRGMSPEELRGLARALAEVQARVAALPRAAGYGFAVDYGDPALLPSWHDVVVAGLEKARARIAQSGACDAGVVDAVRGRLDAFDGYLGGVEPIAFLDDTTTRNVIVHKGGLSGIVDTDYVCFGDRLYTLGLTRMALLSGGLDTFYTDAWAKALALGPPERSAVELYTAAFCVDFLGELGQRFNRDEPVAADRAHVERLLGILDNLLRTIDGADS